MYSDHFLMYVLSPLAASPSSSCGILQEKSKDDVESDWEKQHLVISDGLLTGPRPKTNAADIFDDGDDDEGQGPPAARHQSQTPSAKHHAQPPSAKQQGWPAVCDNPHPTPCTRTTRKDHHKKCRATGIPVCRQQVLQKIQSKFVAAVRTIVAAQKKDDEFKQELLHGFWCFALRGTKTQAVLGPAPLLWEESSQQKPCATYLCHASFVFGGLRQFNPTVLLCDLCDPQGKNAGHDVPWPLPEIIQFTHDGKFLVFHELAKQLFDVEMEWTLQIYKLLDSAAVSASFSTGHMQAKRHGIPELRFWRGLSQERGKRKSGLGTLAALMDRLGPNPKQKNRKVDTFWAILRLKSGLKLVTFQFTSQ